MNKPLLRVDKASNGMISLSQTSNGKMKIVGSTRSHFLERLELEKGDLVRVSFDKLPTKKAFSRNGKTPKKRKTKK